MRSACGLIAAAAAGLISAATPALAQLPPLPSAAGSGLESGAPTGQARGLSVVPGLRTSLMLSDNLLLEPSGDERAGWQADVSPSITASLRTPRAQASLGYALHALYRAAGSAHESTLRHDLRAFGNALLAGDWLGIQGSASTYYANTSPFGLLSPDPITSTTNTSRVSTATLAPYVVGRFGTFADYRADYSLTRTNTSNEVSSYVSRGSDSARLTLVSGPQFRVWGWSFNTSFQRSEYRNDLNLDSAATSFNVYYVISPELRVGASANYVYYEDPDKPRSETSGWGPGLSLDWTPNPRTTLRLNTVDQYYGNSTTLALAHRAERWTVGLNYSRGVYTNVNSGLFLFNPSALIGGGDAYSALLNDVYRQLVAQGVINQGDIIASGILNDALIKSRTLAATLGYRLPRGSIGLTAFDTVRETLLDSSIFIVPGNPLVFSSFGRYKSRGLALNVSVPISTRSDLAFGAALSKNDSLTSDDSTRLTTFNASMSTRFDARTTGSLAYRRTAQSAAQGGLAGYSENAIIGTVDLRF